MISHGTKLIIMITEVQLETSQASIMELLLLLSGILAVNFCKKGPLDIFDRVLTAPLNWYSWFPTQQLSDINPFFKLEFPQSSLSLFLILPAPRILESFIKTEINLIFYFPISFWFLCEALQRSAKIKTEVNFLSSSGIRRRRVKIGSCNLDY